MSVAAATAPGAPQAPTETRRRRHARLLTIAAVGIPTALALALCLYDLTARSLWLDEAATVSIASQHGSAFGAALARDGGNMLGYYGLLHVLIGAFGKGALALRLPSAIGAAATVCVVGLLGLRLFGRRVALAAGLLTAVSLPLVYWGQTARAYTLMVALIAGSFLALVRALGGGRSTAAWISYVVLLVAAVYAGLEAVLVIPAQLILLLWYRDRWRPFAAALAVAAACCAPLAVLASQRGSGQLFWVPGPSFTTAKQVLEALGSSGLQPNFYTGSGDALLVLTGVVLAVGALRIAWLVRDPIERRGAWGAALILAWLIVPVLVALVESAAGQSIFQARYLLVSLPAVALLLAWTALGRWLPTVLGMALLTVVIVLRALQLAPAYGTSPENWRAATSYVLTRAGSGDCVAFYPLDNRMPFQYYVGARAPGAPRSILPAVPWTSVRAYVEDYAVLPESRLAALRAECSRLWLLTSHEGTAGGPPVSQRNLARLNALLAGLERDYPHTSRRTFGTAHTVTLALLEP